MGHSFFSIFVHYFLFFIPAPRWANGSLEDDWSTFVNAGGPVGLDFAWKYGSPHRKDDEDCLFMNDDGEFDDYECDKTRYILCDDGTDVIM